MSGEKMSSAERMETTSEISTLYNKWFNILASSEIEDYYTDFAALYNDEQTADFTIELTESNVCYNGHLGIMV